MKFLAILLSLSLSVSSYANYSLSQSKKKVDCGDDDNLSIFLNAKRSTLKVIVEGESAGSEKIIKTTTDNKTFVSYKTESGTLVLSDKGDSYQYGDDEPTEVTCI